MYNLPDPKYSDLWRDFEEIVNTDGGVSPERLSELFRKYNIDVKNVDFKLS